MAHVKNCTKTALTFSLPHEEEYLQEIPVQLAMQTPDGKWGVKHETRRLPGAVTVLAGGVGEVPDSALETKGPIKAALDRGHLRLIQVEEPKKQPTDDAAPASESNRKESRQ